MRRHPDWLKVPIAGGTSYSNIKKRLRTAKLHTICEEARCPNLAECFSRGTATFLILGDVCTRDCRYCNVNHGNPGSLNLDEAKEVALSVKNLGLKYVVITSVTRDDLNDGGAQVFHDSIVEIKKINPKCKVEVLIPDFNGNETSLTKVLNAKPDVLNHNIEVVKELFKSIRPQGNYDTSMNLLKLSKKIDSNIPTKSGFMIGIGETHYQILDLLDDLKKTHVDFLTIGQYLQPSKTHEKVMKYYTPKEFEEIKKLAYEKGFKHVESGPLVRSSYKADNTILTQQV